MTPDESAPSRPYILGHSESELTRLRTQSSLLEPITAQFLREAEVGSGMRVLDVGSGAGDVAFLVARLVGDAGEVIGCDVAPAAVDTANQRARDRALRNVEFREGNPMEMDFGGAFDAVVGRYVLPFQTDPGAMLRELARRVKPGGRILFHEPEWGFVRSSPPAPLYDQACQWIVDTTRSSGQSWSFLDQVYPAFLEAQLPTPTLRMHTHVSASPLSREWLMAVANMIESILPSIQREGVATAEEVDLPTLRERLWDEAQSTHRVFVGRAEVGMWTTVERPASRIGAAR